MKLWFNLKRQSDFYCCGNCKYRISMINYERSVEGCKKRKFTKSYEYCAEYEFDEMNKELRINNS